MCRWMENHKVKRFKLHQEPAHDDESGRAQAIEMNVKKLWEEVAETQTSNEIRDSIIE